LAVLPEPKLNRSHTDPAFAAVSKTVIPGTRNEESTRVSELPPPATSQVSVIIRLMNNLRGKYTSKKEENVAWLCV
uniref:Polycomb group protein EMBRYONIC FLOWER 2 n=1 Tax=Gongylonema pulchrum TaxID=637853 RepID=A0A183D5F9_9BILA